MSFLPRVETFSSITIWSQEYLIWKLYVILRGVFFILCISILIPKLPFEDFIFYPKSESGNIAFEISGLQERNDIPYTQEWR